MKIGVFSDVHDNITNLRTLLALFTERSVTTLIFCGDFCSPIPVREMGAFQGEIHEERLGDCLWLNPGEVLGWKGTAACVLSDTTTNTADVIAL